MTPVADIAAAAHTDAATRARPDAAARDERPDEGLFILPCGYIADDGTLHREVELSPLTGHDEEYLASVRADTPTASVVTGLLSRCIKRLGSFEPIDAALVRDLLVCDRDYLVVKAREMTFGAKVDAVLGCQNAACGAPLDVSFMLDELHVERRPVETRFFTAELSSAVEMRLPTGGDQEDIGALYRTDEEKAVNLLMARCLRRVGARTDIDEAFVESLAPGVRREIEAEMLRRAPQVNIELEGLCPECGEPFSTMLDFMAFFAAEMRTGLAALEREVHFLARHYHWSEREILSLTRQKRRRYLSLLREELEGFD